jgi:hypothetical protein
MSLIFEILFIKRKWRIENLTNISKQLLTIEKLKEYPFVVLPKLKNEFGK